MKAAGIGMPLPVRQGAMDRLPAILITAIVTGLGLLPLALSAGTTGDEIEGPMAIVILGGLISATVLTLAAIAEPCRPLRKVRYQNPAVVVAPIGRDALASFGGRLSQQRDGISGRTATKSPAWPFALLCTVGFLGRLSYEMLRSPVTALYAKHIGAPIQVIGLLVAAVTITGIFVKFPSGALSDLFGFRRLMQAGMTVKATAPFIYLVVATWPQLLILRFYHGLSTALYAPAASAKVAKLYPEQRARRLGIYGAAENAGVTFGPVAGAAILAATSFPITFVVSGVIGIAAFLAVLPLPRDAPADQPSHSLKDIIGALATGLKQIIGDGAIRLVSLMEATVYTGVGTLQAYLPLYALTVHIPIAEIGLLFGAQGVASIICRPFTGGGADRFGRRPFIIGGVLLCAAVLIAVPNAGGFWPLLGLSIAFGVGTAMVTPSTTALIGDLVKRGEFGAAMGVFGSLWDIGHASGPLIAGFLIAALGYQIAFLIIALAILAALVVFVIGSRRYGLR